MPEQTAPEVPRLRRLACEAAARTPDLTAELSGMIKLAADAGTDPYIVMGILIEGIAHTLAARIPPERRKDVAQASVHMLRDRMQATGAL